MARSLIKRNEPIYPIKARERKIRGTVELQILISETGTVEEIKILSGEPVLAGAAIAAIRQSEYKPMSVQGRRVRIVTSVTVNFK